MLRICRTYLGFDRNLAHQIDQVKGNLNPRGSFLHLALGGQTQGEDQVSRLGSFGERTFRGSLCGLIRDLLRDMKTVNFTMRQDYPVLTTRLLNHLAVCGFFSASTRPMLLALRM
jgi:hypothetical protein